MINQISVGDYVLGFDFPEAAKWGGGTQELINKEIIENASFTIRRVGKKKTEKLDVCKFRWIPWVPGKINWCDAVGVDVLSGWFSGCWMARYKETNFKVCHIATDKLPDLDCKQKWRDKMGESGVSKVTQFTPHTATSKGQKLGLVTSTGKFYGIGLESAAALKLPNTRKKADEWIEYFKKKNIPCTKQQAKKYAKMKEHSFTNFYPGKAFKIVEVSKPIESQTFQ